MFHFCLMSKVLGKVFGLFLKLEYLVISHLACLELTQVIMMVSVNASSQATVFVGQVVVVTAGVVMMMVSVMIVV